MDAYLAVVSRGEVRDYAARPVGADAARRIREAGRIAGSSKTRRARRFPVLRSPALVERAAETGYAPSNLRGAALVVAIVTRGKGPLAFRRRARRAEHDACGVERGNRVVPERRRRP